MNIRSLEGEIKGFIPKKLVQIESKAKNLLEYLSPSDIGTLRRRPLRSALMVAAPFAAVTILVAFSCAALTISTPIFDGVLNEVIPPKPTPTLTTAEKNWKAEIKKADQDPAFRSWLRANHPDDYAERFLTPVSKR